MSESGRYKIGTLSRLSGLKPELLRAWQRRFQLFEPERTEGSHRLYTPDDLRLALYLRDLVASGQTIGALASRGRAALLSEAQEQLPDLDVATLRAVPSTPRSTDEQLTELAAQVVRSAVELDPGPLAAALDRGLASCTPEQFLSRVVRPVSHRIGELWAQGECSVAGEHLASSMLRERLLRLLQNGAPPDGRAAPEALVACAPDDFHENGALMTAVRLVGLGWRVTWLGAATPLTDLDKACRSRRPHAVYVSATLTASFEACRDGLLAFARRWQGAFELRIGGGGVPEQDAELSAAGAELSPRWSPPRSLPG